MAKGELPGSMDLLLDTMCNTFGGVMFIAISMALTISLCQSRIDPEAQEELANETLKELMAENRQLREARKNLDRRVETLQKYSVPDGTVSNELAEQVAKLEMQQRHNQRRIEEMTEQKKKLEREIADAKQQQQQKKQDAESEKEQLAKRLKELQKLYAELQQQVGKLKTPLEQSLSRSIHFTRSKRTNAVPYAVIVANDRLYRLGSDVTRASKEVDVRREGNALLLSLKSGVPLSVQESRSGREVLPGFDSSRHFVWIIVHPDSFSSFVSFRRLMRKFNYNVHWYIDGKFVLYLTDKAEYSSSE